MIQFQAEKKKKEKEGAHFGKLNVLCFVTMIFDTFK